MRRLAFLLLAGLAAACAPRSVPGEPPARTAAEAECRAQAQRTPEMRTVMREVNPGNPENLQRIRREELDVEARFVADCLRARGLPAPGGVEPIRGR